MLSAHSLAKCKTLTKVWLFSDMSVLQTPKRRCALALVARLPSRGSELKTRLTPPLTPAEAAALKDCFLRDMTANIGHIADSGRGEGVIIFTPAGVESTLREIAPKGFKLFLQRGEKLGDVLANATEDLLNRGFPSVCLINSDAPTSPRSFLEVGIEALARPGDRVVLGSVDGGGYYLIGLTAAHRDLLDRISSSTANVVAHTTARAAQIGLKVEMLPPWYEVVDAQSLKRLCEELLGTGRQPSAASQREKAYSAPYTRQYLAKLIETEEGRQRVMGDGRS